MDAASNKIAIRKALAAYGAGDLAPLLALLHDDVVWTAHALEGHYRFGGRHVGRASVVAALSMIAADYAINAYVVEEITAEGDIVWAANVVHVTERRLGGEPFPVKLANRWRFRDGKIISVDEYFDTAGALCEEGRVPASVPRSAALTG